MIRRSFMALGLALAMATIARADPQTVTGVVGDTVRTYDAQGVSKGEINKSELGRSLPTAVVGKDAKGHPGIVLKGTTIYVKAADVIMTDDTNCKAVAVAAKPGGSRLAATAGIVAGASEHQASCIPAKP